MTTMGEAFVQHTFAGGAVGGEVDCVFVVSTAAVTDNFLRIWLIPWPYLFEYSADFTPTVLLCHIGPIEQAQIAAHTTFGENRHLTH